MPEPYAFPSIGAFRDRREELAVIEEWFSDLREVAAREPHIRLVELEELVEG